MSSEINLTEQLLTLVKAVGELTTKMDTVQQKLDDISKIQEKVSSHDIRLDQITLNLQRGDQRFLKIDEKFDKIYQRLDKIEHAEGDQAKDTLRRIWQYILIAVVGAVVSNIPTIIQSLAK